MRSSFSLVVLAGFVFAVCVFAFTWYRENRLIPISSNVDFGFQSNTEELKTARASIEKLAQQVKELQNQNTELENRVNQRR